MPNKQDLVAYFQFNESSSSDPLLDSHISGYSLAKVNANQITTTAGIVNGARFMNRTNQHYFRSDDEDFYLGGAAAAFTVSIWWFPTLLPAGTDLPMCSVWSAVGNDRQFSLDYRVNDGNWRAFVSANGQNATGVGSTAFTNAVGNVWHHVVLRYDGSELALFVNDNKFAVNAPAMFAGNGNAFFEIGARTEATAFQEGRLDECAVYRRALTDAEVTELFGGGSPPEFTAFSDGVATNEPAQRTTRYGGGRGLTGKHLRVDNHLQVTRDQSGPEVVTIAYRERPD